MGAWDWFTGITDSIGSVLGDVGDSIGGLFSSDDLASSASENDIWNAGANIASGVKPSSGFSFGDIASGLGQAGQTGVSLWPSIIGAGTQLAGSYFNQANSKENAEAYAQSVANQIEAQKAENALDREKSLEIARIAAAASAGNARKSTLASLYNNWATNTAQGGANQAQSAIGAGKAITDGINARAAVLR